MSDVTTSPVGSPAASTTNPASSPVNERSSATREPKDGNHTVPIRRRNKRLGTERLESVEKSLSERDWAILRTAEQYRFVTGAQLVALLFTDHASVETAARTARTVLSRLRRLRILDTLETRIGGIRAGSDGLVYFIGPVGDRILRQEDPGRSRRRLASPSVRFLEHTLAITGMAVGLHEAARHHGGEVVALAPEKPRSFTDLLGTRQVIKPDLAAELAATLGTEDLAAFFIELDLGTESIPTLIGKCVAYEEYRRSGEEQRRFGGFPAIVWAMTATRPQTALRRRQDLARALERHPMITATDYRILPLETTSAEIFAEVSHA